MITGKDPRPTVTELWIVSAMVTEVEVAGGTASIDDEHRGLVCYFPVYSSKAAALADHPKIAAMDAVGQANHLRCVTLN